MIIIMIMIIIIIIIIIMIIIIIIMIIIIIRDELKKYPQSWEDTGKSGFRPFLNLFLDALFSDRTI